MCISVLLWQAHPLYPLLLLANRDEYLDRETEPLKWWEGGKMLGGRDVTAGGTWLASSREGKVALVTNVREVKSISAAKSRGDLPVRFLQSKKSPMEFAEEVGNEADEYNGFNLIVADILSKNMVYVTNRLKGESSSYMTRVSPGVHVLSNASLDTPWPKAQRLERGFKDLLDEYGVGEIPIIEMVDKLMGNTVKDDISMLPGIRSPEIEYELSSVFVDTLLTERPYGTRSMSALAVKVTGEVFFYEKHLENGLWKEQTQTYTIEKNDKCVN
ncbi:putative transport and Golgi organization protein [Helianthus annuus]|uniref:Transport and Golgi organization protein n=1 Tax=Helianthus annuus TaxID=4232 RepID=A0A251SDL4_HELAN|nr:transport and Golgi organization 2 homolog [Helianthus annuus]KAF5767253.1 putative transport and Golgi organization protein [Helianthus annuus]KAJ0484188.1 putative transport and Golgi organization protein [Helianthus annuus]KAJ0658490.1 putative transport and Golgi organization protein [Helianthus annuus]